MSLYVALGKENVVSHTGFNVPEQIFVRYLMPLNETIANTFAKPSEPVGNNSVAPTTWTRRVQQLNPPLGAEALIEGEGDVVGIASMAVCWRGFEWTSK